MAETIDDASAGTTETKWEREQSPEEFVTFWLERIELAMKAEDEYRKRAEANTKRYTNEQHIQVPGITTASSSRSARKFNIFYTNVETVVPAVINSAPVPDVRRRFGDADPAARIVAQVLERTLTVAMDQFHADQVFRGCEKDNEITGRGFPRLRYADENGEQRVWLEAVDWRDFVRGPAKVWSDLPFIAFREYLTRDQLNGINPKIGGQVNMDATVVGADDKDATRRDGRNMGDAMKRARVWQIWDKERKEMIQIAEGYKTEPLAIIPDPLQLQDFYPIPEPLYAVRFTHNLSPIDPLRQYEDQADELDDITQRLSKLVRAARWRGIGNAGMSGAFIALKDAADGEIVPSSNAQEFREGEIDRSIWMMPTEKLTALIDRLYAAREEVKRTIFEITGVADIMRGDTNPNETLGAQKIKAQWGSLRIQQRQADMQRLCRDSLRMMSEVICQFFTPQTIKAMTQIDLEPAPPEVMAQIQQAMAAAQQQAMAAQAAQQQGGQPQPAGQLPPELQQFMEQEKVKAEALSILKSDALRTYRVDVETDSTIRADLGRAQENFGTFVTGLGQFFTAVAPAVQAGAMPLDIAVKILTGMARSFKLGRQAEDALEEWSKKAEAGAQQGQQQQKPDPAAEKVKAEMQIKAADAQATHQRENAKFQFAQKQHADQMGMEQQKAQADVALKEHEAMVNERVEMAKLQLQREQGQQDHAAKREDIMRQRDVEDRTFDLQSQESTHKRRMDSVAAGHEAAPEIASLVETVVPVLEKISEGMQAQAQAIDRLAQAEMAEKELVRGPDGKPSGVRKKLLQPVVT